MATSRCARPSRAPSSRPGSRPTSRASAPRVDAALADAAIAPGAVDRVFLTGGTSLVPAVRRMFEDRFGAERVVAGGEFVSVAEGLALMG